MGIRKSQVQCELFPKGCIIAPGQSGECRVRVNIDGVLRAVTYGYPCSVNIDPVEKKPLFHFLPGTQILSIATVGCNLHCKNCQNWEISQANPDLKSMSDAFYRDVCSATLKPIQGALVLAKSMGGEVEVTNLIIPTLNDTPEEIRELTRWVRANLGPETPLHFSGVAPMHQSRSRQKGAKMATRKSLIAGSLSNPPRQDRLNAGGMEDTISS